MARGIALRKFKRLGRNIHRIDPRIRELHGAGDGNASRAGADIQYAPHLGRVEPRLEAGMDEFGERRAWHDDSLIDFEFEPGKPHASHEVRRRNASLDARREQRQHGLDLVRRKRT